MMKRFCIFFDDFLDGWGFGLEGFMGEKCYGWML
jgi:hypothetical protein